MSDSELLYRQWKKTTAVLIDKDTLRAARGQMGSCESCTPDLAETLFDSILDDVTGCDPEVTDYVLAEPAQCPRCARLVQTGYWHLHESEPDGQKVFVV